VNAAETHGSLCGVLCAVGEISEEDWLKMAIGDGGGELVVPSASEKKVLLDVAKKTLADLNDGNLSFQLILPNDEADLEDQVMALGDWCRGFMFGLSHGGIQELNKLPGDASEVVADFLEISQIGVDGMDREEAEAQLLELSEYVRVGVVLVNEELQPLKETPKDTAH
jgi:hypothetical protein